jgi:hypothetical protein
LRLRRQGADGQRLPASGRMISTMRTPTLAAALFAVAATQGHIGTSVTRPESSPDGSRVGGVSSAAAAPVANAVFRPRKFDSRVGYFGTGGDSISGFAQRWNLEKGKPLVFSIGDVPGDWKPFVEEGIKEWNKAFAAAGLPDALEVGSGGAVTVEWVPGAETSLTTERQVNAQTGEITSAKIRIGAGAIKRLRTMYFVAVGASEPKLVTSENDPSVIGPMLQAAVAHEVGHALGLHGNLLASFPADSARKSSWVKRMGPTATVMSDRLVNAFARNADGIVTADFIARVGPYDVAAIRWGYGGDAGASGVAAQMAGSQATRWRPEARSVATMMQAGLTASVSDAMQRALAFEANIRGIMPLLRTYAMQKGDEDALYANVYTYLLFEWERTMRDVVAGVAGYTTRDGRTLTPIPLTQQRTALDFVRNHVFIRPDGMMDSLSAERWLPQDTSTLQLPMSRLRTAVSDRQAAVMNELLHRERLLRLWNAEEKAHAKLQFSLDDLLASVRGMVWDDVVRSLSPTRDTLKDSLRLSQDRRDLQYEYLAAIGNHVNEPPPPKRSSNPLIGRYWRELPPAPPRAMVRRIRSDLVRLGMVLDSALLRPAEPTTKRHLKEMRSTLREVLDPRKG